MPCHLVGRTNISEDLLPPSSGHVGTRVRGVVFRKIIHLILILLLLFSDKAFRTKAARYIRPRNTSIMRACLSIKLVLILFDAGTWPHTLPYTPPRIEHAAVTRCVNDWP